MRKAVMTIPLSLFSSSAFAADVKISSFTYYGTAIAEAL